MHLLTGVKQPHSCYTENLTSGPAADDVPPELESNSGAQTGVKGTNASARLPANGLSKQQHKASHAPTAVSIPAPAELEDAEVLEDSDGLEDSDLDSDADDVPGMR